MDEIHELNEIYELNEMIVKLNDQLGIMGNNLIQINSELDYLKIEYQKLLIINKELREMKQKKWMKIY